MEPATPNPLMLPVGALMRPAASVGVEGSLELAGLRLREGGAGVVAVVDGHTLVGAISEKSFACALADGIDLAEPNERLMAVAATVHPYETGAQALRLMTEANHAALFVIDDERRLMGVVVPSDLLPRRRHLPRPPAVGGMATPFGVYLTTGAIHAGARWYGLVATGALLFTLLLTAQLLSYWVGNAVLGEHGPTWAVTIFESVIPIALFFLGMRLIPLSGTHASEHQVVHAIERGEELVPSIVRRMPRVHPRCGTNLAVGISLFLGIAGTTVIANQEIRLLIALVVSAATWRPLGSLLQFYVTTKPASERQLAGSIQAGRELLDKYSQSRIIVPTIPLRIWNSGVIHVIAGSFVAYGVVAGLSALFGWNLGF